MIALVAVGRPEGLASRGPPALRVDTSDQKRPEIVRDSSYLRPSTALQWARYPTAMVPPLTASLLPLWPSAQGAWPSSVFDRVGSDHPSWDRSGPDVLLRARGTWRRTPTAATVPLGHELSHAG